MKTLKVFILGLLYGWFLKFAIDKIYRDNELEWIRNENVSLKEHIRLLEAKPPSESFTSQPAARTAAPIKSAPTETGKDDLKTIKGIGPAIERKLNEAGVDTFQALSRMTVEELENILGSTKRLVKDAGNLIDQARTLAQQKNRQ